MDLEFSDEQEMLREMIRGVCADHCGLEVVRELEDDATGYDEGFWRQLVDLDLVGLLLPTDYGGSGQSMLEGVVMYEEFGRALAPSPHFVSTVLAGGVLARAGSDDQKQAWLPRLATGEAIASVAWLEPENGFRPQGVQVTATADGEGFRLDGVKEHVFFGSAADVLVVLARTGDGPTDVDLFLVEADTDGLTLDQRTSIASDTQYRARFDGVTVEAGARIGEAGTGWDTWDAVMLDGAILQAAWCMGGAQYALDITVQYAKDREQFGKPLGAFQAIGHYLADAVTEVDGGSTLVHEAAWARAEGRPVGLLAPQAKLFAGQTFRDVTATAQQIWGGVGFTLEYDIQLYFRRAKSAQLNWWDRRACEERIATAVLDERLVS